KNAFLFLYIGFIAGTLACGLAPDFWLLLASRTLTGAFGGLLGGQAMAIVADVFPEKRRGQATGALMSAFAVASVAGVPLGIVIGNKYGWQVPFLVLAVLSLPLLALATWAMPPIRDHLGPTGRRSPAKLGDILSQPNHQWAFLLVSLLMFGAFMVIPFISTYYLANVGVNEDQLPVIFMAGGLVTLVGSPLIGRSVDRYGRLRMFRVLLPFSAVMVLVITHLPTVGITWAATATACFMLANTGRMVAAMALINGCVEPAKRGGFMSANSSFQHIAGGLGTTLGGLLVTVQPGEPFFNFDKVGYVALGATLASLLIVGRLKPLPTQNPVTVQQSLAAAAEAQADAGEALELPN
ncbi:MAG: MFS transporter, partial [Gemmataceae bacterium]